MKFLGEGGKKLPRKLKDIWLIMTVMLLIFWLMFIAVSVATMQVLERQNTESMQSVLEFASSRLEGRLTQIEDFLQVTLVSNADFNRFRSSSLNRASNLRQISLDMEAYGQYFPDFSGMFFYEPADDLLIVKQWNDIYDYSFSNETRRIEMYALMRTAGDADGEGIKSGEWTIGDVDGKWTAFYVYQYMGQFLGVYVSLDGALERIIDFGTVEGFEESVLIDEEGYELTGEKERFFAQKRISHWEDGSRYLQLVERIDGFPAAIVTLIPSWKLQGNQLIWWSGLLALSFLSGFFLIRLLKILQRLLFVPLSELNWRMKAISEGDMSSSIVELAGCQEVRELSATFNEMIGQLRDMKIENYEKRIENQETELKYLQIQKNPHFFLNVLNVIYSLAASGNVMQIRTVTLELIRHVRYVLSVEKPLVPLAQELEFTRNFVEIQRIRIPYEIRMEVEGFSKEVGRIRVPPLVLQTFVENAVKYAVSEEDMLQISLEARLTQDWLNLRISDSGPGFPEKLLEELNTTGRVPADGRGEHIGIHNVISRMKLLYGENYHYHFSNLPARGACVEFTLCARSDFQKQEV